MQIYIFLHKITANLWRVHSKSINPINCKVIVWKGPKFIIYNWLEKFNNLSLTIFTHIASKQTWNILVLGEFAASVVTLGAWKSALWGKIATCLSEVCNGASFAFVLMFLADSHTPRVTGPRNRPKYQNISCRPQLFWLPLPIDFYPLFSYII